MTEFGYVAIAADGAETRGNISADSLDAATTELKRMGLLPLKVAESSLLTRNYDISMFDRKPSARDLSVFCRQFVSILNAGVTIIQALDMLSGQSESKMLAKTLLDVKMSVEKGESLADACKPHIKIFGEMFIPLVSAGEASGSLSQSFERMAEQYEKGAKIQGLVKKAAIYPVILLLVTIGVLIVMLVMVVPTFTEMFDEMGIELPTITKMVVSMSDFFKVYWYIAIGVVVAVVIGFRLFLKTDLGKMVVATAATKIPVISNLTIKNASSRMSRTLSTLMGAGLPLIRALEITRDTMSNLLFRNALDKAREEVSIGVLLSESIKNDGHFPPLVYQMLNIGEESGSTEDMLGKIADYYDEEVETATASLMAMMEPMIIVLMAGVVGFIILSIMLPVASMYGGLDQL
jgi:type IV pilus assembly protein PilC